MNPKTRHYIQQALTAILQDTLRKKVPILFQEEIDARLEREEWEIFRTLAVEEFGAESSEALTNAYEDSISFDELVDRLGEYVS